MRYNQLSYEDCFWTNTLILNLRNCEWLKCQFCHLFYGCVCTFANAKKWKYPSRLWTVALHILYQSYYNCKMGCSLHISLSIIMQWHLLICTYKCMGSSMWREGISFRKWGKTEDQVFYHDSVYEFFIRPAWDFFKVLTRTELLTHCTDGVRFLFLMGLRHFVFSIGEVSNHTTGAFSGFLSTSPCHSSLLPSEMWHENNWWQERLFVFLFVIFRKMFRFSNSSPASNRNLTEISHSSTSREKILGLHFLTV